LLDFGDVIRGRLPKRGVAFDGWEKDPFGVTGDALGKVGEWIIGDKDFRLGGWGDCRFF